MPENLVESILFGHEKGSFTGATERHTGKFVEASGGTLLLDEVGELPPAAQVKLLRAIQEGEVEPVGARRPVKVDVRIVSATNRDLIADVKAGRFREDLFYRLHVFPITVPPLRARPADIPALARHFLARFAAEEGKRLRAVTPEALRLLTAIPLARQYPPIGERRVSRGRAGGRRQPGCRRVSPNRRANRRARCWRKRRAGVRRGNGTARPMVRRLAGELDLAPEQFEDHALAPPLAAMPVAADPGDMLPLLDADGDVRPLEAVEADLIRYAITHYRGQMSEVARKLQIGRSTLYRKLDALGLNPGRGEAEGRGRGATAAKNRIKRRIM